MISWIQHHLIRHGRWVFLTLLAVIIVAFVFTIGNTPGCTTNDRSGYEENLFYGIDLKAQREQSVLTEKVSLSAFLNTQQFRSNEQFQAAIMSRVALLYLADEIGVAGPTQEAIAEFIRTKNAFRGQDGAFSTDAYTRFVDSVESNPSMPRGLVMTVLTEDYRIEQVQSAISGPGYILPSEAVAQAQRTQTEYGLSTAEISFADFTPEIDPSDADLASYFDETKQRYEIPERIEAGYVKFVADEFLNQVPEADDASLREHFAEERAGFVATYKAANPTPEGEEAVAVTFDLVRDDVAASLADSRASRLANEAAQAFAYKLYIDSIGRESESFDNLVTKSGVELISIEPYTLEAARQSPLSSEMLESAFALSGSRYYSDAYAVDGGFAVLIYSGRIAPTIPPYEDVADQVQANYVSEETRRLFNEKGERLKAELELALIEGKDFVETAESIGLSAKRFETFTPADAPAELNRSALTQAQSMVVGKVSPMLTLNGIGTFIYLSSKEIPEVDIDSEEIEQSKMLLERWAAFSTQDDLVNELIVRGLPDAPTAE